ncbi:MAG: ABC transporter ATP-binding protein [Rhodobacteraceae bacterium]|nr:ABC transporter ATP-binding protein [Paracoccaceae bacterium]
MEEPATSMLRSVNDPLRPGVNSSGERVLSIEGLRVEFRLPDESTEVLCGVDLTARPGEIVGVVGESGSGKTVAALAVVGLLPSAAHVSGGSVRFFNENLLDLDSRQMRAIRGSRISMIFQNPRASLNPVFTVGRMLREVLLVHSGLRGRKATVRAQELLADVGLPDPSAVMRRYPHQLSGGMAQRAMIALALSSSPDLLLADEPTTALDVTIQHQIIQLLLRLRKRQNLTQIVITHNFGVVAELCDRVAVMYAGAILEEAPVGRIFEAPGHPYTRGLLSARARVEQSSGIRSIPGQVPELKNRPTGCSFHPRCEHARDICRVSTPRLESSAPNHSIACHRWRELAQ